MEDAILDQMYYLQNCLNGIENISELADQVRVFRMVMKSMELLGFDNPYKHEQPSSYILEEIPTISFVFDTFIAKHKFEQQQEEEAKANANKITYMKQENNQYQYVFVSFDQVINWVQNNDSLSKDESEKIQSKIKELQVIADSIEDKHTKWNRVKPVLPWLGDKGVDIAIQLIPLIMRTLSGSG